MHYVLQSLGVTMKTILQIEGMSCAHCVQHVKKALEAVAGVTSANVNLKNKSAEVEHGDNVNIAAMKTTVEDAGFTVK